MFSLICARINGRVNNGEAGDLRRHRGRYDVIVIQSGHKFPNVAVAVACAKFWPNLIISFHEIEIRNSHDKAYGMYAEWVRGPYSQIDKKLYSWYVFLQLLSWDLAWKLPSLCEI